MYIKKFNTVNEENTYYFFEDYSVKCIYQRKKKEFISDSNCLVTNRIHYFKDKCKMKLAIKLRLIDANHCPGSCMFVFWIYRITDESCVLDPQLYIYTGDYLLNDAISKQLLNYRYSEEFYYVTMVNDNTRLSETDYAVTYDEAMCIMKKFIEYYRERTSGMITVVIGADWGMEDLWIDLAREYKSVIYVEQDTYRLIQLCMGEEYIKHVKTADSSSVSFGNTSESSVKYMFFIISKSRFELCEKNSLDSYIQEEFYLNDDTLFCDYNSQYSQRDLTLFIRPEVSPNSARGLKNHFSNFLKLPYSYLSK